MTRRIGYAVLAATLTLFISTPTSLAAGVSAAVQGATISSATDTTARRHDRRTHHYVYHPYYPYYYGHPYYYSPGPILLLPAPPGWDLW